jgi:hypothetical protein
MIEGGDTVRLYRPVWCRPTHTPVFRVVQERGEARHNSATFAGRPSASMGGAWGGQLIEYIPSFC